MKTTSKKTVREGTVICFSDKGGLLPILGDQGHGAMVKFMKHLPKPDPKFRIGKGLATGEPPSRFELRPGWTFSDRCPLAEGVCLRDVPEIRDIRNGRLAACHKL